MSLTHPESLPKKKPEKRAQGYGCTTPAQMTPYLVARRTFRDTMRYHDAANGVSTVYPHRLLIALGDSIRVFLLLSKARRDLAKPNPRWVIVPRKNTKPGPWRAGY